MTDHDALLAAIIAAPKEDTPRLAYADWLDENAGTVGCGACGGTGKISQRVERKFQGATQDVTGMMRQWDRSVRCLICSGSGRVSDGRAQRAEFIRVQCELARLEADSKGPQESRPYPVRIENLRRRERELLDAHGGSWVGVQNESAVHQRNAHPVLTVPNGWSNEDYLFHRGFCFACIHSWAWWRTHAAAILARQPVERVKYTDHPPPSAMAEFMFVVVGKGFWRDTRWPKIEFELPAAGEPRVDVIDEDDWVNGGLPEMLAGLGPTEATTLRGS